MTNTKPFTFEYDATEGVLIAAALREKADAEIDEARQRDQSPVMKGYGAEQARNRAQLFRNAADAIHAPVQEALASDMDAALRKAGL